MHELPVTEKILEIALRHARESKVTKIHSLTLSVGGLCDLEDKWLQHYFDYLSKDTAAEKAILKIKKVPISLRCGQCGTFFETTRKQLEQQNCPHCKINQGFTVVSGREYSLEEMEAE